jgi:hypothetical protein
MSRQAIELTDFIRLTFTAIITPAQANIPQTGLDDHGIRP